MNNSKPFIDDISTFSKDIGLSNLDKQPDYDGNSKSDSEHFEDD